MDNQAECAELAELLAEVATGAASGPDRARVLRHLNECDDCRYELGELSRIADEVLLIAPEHEPPAAFESTVLDQIAALAGVPGVGGRVLAGVPGVGRGVPAPAIRPRARRWSIRSLYAAAAAVFTVAGAGAVWQSTADERELASVYRETLDVADGRYFTAASLTDAAGAEVGHIFLYEGDPSWIFAVLGPQVPPGTYQLVVRTADRAEVVAVCEVESQGCSAGGTVDVGLSVIEDVHLAAADGTTFTADPPSRSRTA